MSDSMPRDKLLQELAALRDAAAAVRGDQPGHDVLAVMKFFSGLSLDAVSRLAPEHDFGPLLALPLEGDLYPLVLHLLRTFEELTVRTGCDPATGLPDGKAFAWAMEMEVERAVRNQTSLSLAILEIGWPPSYGPMAGARLEQTMAQATGLITTDRRKYDFVARTDGNRFAMLYPGIGLQRTRSIMERLQAGIDSLNVQNPERLASSVGIASIKGRIPMTGKDFLVLAEDALSQARNRGGSIIVEAPIPDIAVTLKSTLVHAREKQFLFTGS